jgi:Fe-S-cluster-containing hydrogenase component 2
MSFINIIVTSASYDIIRYDECIVYLITVYTFILALPIINEDWNMPWVNKKKCVSCKKCVKRCPVDAIDMVKGKALITDDKCIYCGKCVKVCPVKAILKDREFVELRIRDNLKALKGPLSRNKGKNARKRMIKSRIRQLRNQQKVIRGTINELKQIT